MKRAYNKPVAEKLSFNYSDTVAASNNAGGDSGDNGDNGWGKGCKGVVWVNRNNGNQDGCYAT